jgi:hypothetical protein
MREKLRGSVEKGARLNVNHQRWRSRWRPRSAWPCRCRNTARN